jgi:hypothetical protein
VREAGNFIASEFAKFKLTPLSQNFKQSFSYPINTFPGNMYLRVNGVLLKPGVDFLVDPSCKSVTGKFYTKTAPNSLLESLINLKQFAQKDSTTALLLNYTDSLKKQSSVPIKVIKDVLKAPLLIETTTSKLTWSTATYQNTKPILLVNNTFFNDTLNEVEVNIEQKFIPDFTTQNIVGMIQGQRSDSTLVLTAHYDHLGMMGSNAIFNGANDNAGGVAMLLSFAKYYASNKPKFNTVCIAFSGEEAGLIGSEYFVNNPLVPLDRIKFLFNMDLMCNGEEGITIVNGQVYEKEFLMLDSINKKNNFVAQIKSRGKAANSDHYWFSEKGVPSFFAYTMGGVPHYHDVNDRTETLSFKAFESIFDLIKNFLAQF